MSKSMNARFKHSYNELVYQPMLEVINYLQTNNIDVYIVCGVGTFSKLLFNEAHKNNWQIISMKKDWKVIFPFEMNNQFKSIN